MEHQQQAEDLLCHACGLWLQAGQYTLSRDSHGNPECPRCRSGAVELLSGPELLLQVSVRIPGARQGLPMPFSSSLSCV
jgi:Zn finger protein HypA/HybF involved in hydrogenase expression